MKFVWVTMMVSDLEKTQKFYEEIVGLKPMRKLKTDDNTEIVFLGDGDTQIEKNGVTLIVDSMSLQYLVGGTVEYTTGLDGSRFFVDNPNATATCGCGSSFSM